MAQPNVLQTYFVAVNLMTGPMTRMQTGLMQMTAAAHQLNTAMAATNATLMSVGMSALMMGAVVAVPLGLAAHAAAKFEKSMSNVSTLVDTTKESMQLMGDEVLNIAKKIPVPIHDLTEALYYVRSAGVSAADAMMVLNTSGKLAVAGLSTTVESAKAITSALVAFKKEGLSAEAIANDFFLTVKEGKTTMSGLNESFGSTALIVANAGMKLGEFNAATAAMTNAGFTASEAQTALRGAVIALIKPTGEMVDILKAMGLEGPDAGTKLIEKMGGVVNAMNAVKDAAGTAGDNINKAFGRVQGLNALIALTGNQRDAFQAFMKERQQGTAPLMDAFNKQMQTAAASMEIAKNQLTILGIRIGGILLPALVKVGAAIIPVIEGIGNFAREHQTLTSIIVGSISTFALFALTIGSVSLALSTLIKAQIMWKTVMGGYAILMNRATSALVGFYMTVEVGNITLLSALGTLGIYAAAIGALAVMFGGKLYDNTQRYDKLLVQTKDGMKDLVKPTEQATIALNDYIDTKNKFQRTQNFQKFLDYERSKGGDFAAQRAILKNAIFSEDRDIVWFPQREAPKASDFPGIDPAAAAKADSTMNVYVNTTVDKDGNSNTTVTNNGNIPVNIKKTGVPQ